MAVSARTACLGSVTLDTLAVAASGTDAPIDMSWRAGWADASDKVLGMVEAR